MRIVQVAPLEESVPPQKYGGTELVIHNVTEEMVKKGHEVFLLASGDSQTSAQLVPIIPQSLRKMYKPDEIDTWRNFLKIYHISTILEKIKELKPDVVHNHYAWRLIQFRDFIECPMFSTMHGPITNITERYTYEQHADANYVSISDNQRKALPDLNWVKTVYNGIDVTKFPVGDGKRDYFVFLGRTSPEKGLKEICTLIKQTTHKLKIAAKIDTNDRAYFEQEVKPLIDGKQIEFLGEVDHAGKVELLKQAKALLLWLNWEEPFGLVVTEAMACGTPVIVNKRGSMPELMLTGQTGFLVDSLAEMKARFDEVDSISSAFCRQHVETYFSSSVMADEYLSLARRLTTER